MNEESIISKIKKQLFIIAMGIVVIGIMLGIALSDTMGMFYNILIMPTIGAIGYFALNKKAYHIPIALFVFSYVGLFIKYIFQGIFEEGFIISMFVMPVYWSGIYAGLCTVGVIIALLLKIAFGKEVKNES
ncbi:zf-HC2 domain-containing protein [Alkalibaculum sp. M08DMB]|nr:zf-HC2 domain-containing protein [Alkalibaculum sporogenes]MPW24208.1 zf-HC2 domain-containing protein [Alkalibaculum sporogenes]